MVDSTEVGERVRGQVWPGWGMQGGGWQPHQPEHPCPGRSRKPWEALEEPWLWTMHCPSRASICGWQGHWLTPRWPRQHRPC